MSTGPDRIQKHARGERAQKGDARSRSANAFRDPEAVAPAKEQGASTTWLESMGTGRLAQPEIVAHLQQSRGNLWVQRLAAQAGATGEDTSLAQRIRSASAGGFEIASDALAKLEDGLGTDLRDVHVHTGREADRLARALGATAFTTETDIFFRDGAYDPASEEGLTVLAHEAVHVVQQAAGPVAGDPLGGDLQISNPSDSFERAAEETASRVVRGESAPTDAASSPKDAPRGGSIQRYKGDFFDNPTLDAASSLAWDVGGMIPGIGTGVNLAALAIDLGKAGINYGFGDNEAGAKNLRAAGGDAIGMIPGVGTVTGYLNLMQDIDATRDRYNGVAPELAPTSGDTWDRYLTSLPDAPVANPNEGAEGSGGSPPSAPPEVAPPTTDPTWNPDRPITETTVPDMPAPVIDTSNEQPIPVPEDYLY